MTSLLLALAMLAAVTPDASDGMTFAKQLAAEYAAQTHGFVTFLVTTQSDVRGGPVHRAEISETVYFDENGLPSRKRVRKDVRNGKPLDTDELARLSASEEGPISRFGMKAPYATASVGDYAFGRPQETDAFILVDFTPNVPDGTHGSGTIAYSRAAGRIDHVTYKPALLPKEPGSVVLTSTTIEITFGSVAADRWDIVKIVRSFTGREGPFSGRGTVTSMYDGYRLHPNAAAALAALEEPAS
jgi:hypothetical protein